MQQSATSPICSHMPWSIPSPDDDHISLSAAGVHGRDKDRFQFRELWNDICLLNRENLIEALAVFQKNLDRLDQYIKAGNSDSLKNEFRKARL